MQTLCRNSEMSSKKEIPFQSIVSHVYTVSFCWEQSHSFKKLGNLHEGFHFITKPYVLNLKLREGLVKYPRTFLSRSKKIPLYSYTLCLTDSPNNSKADQAAPSAKKV